MCCVLLPYGLCEYFEGSSGHYAQTIDHNSMVNIAKEDRYHYLPKNVKIGFLRIHISLTCEVDTSGYTYLVTWTSLLPCLPRFAMLMVLPIFCWRLCSHTKPLTVCSLWSLFLSNCKSVCLQ